MSATRSDSVFVLVQPARYVIPVECRQSNVDQGNVRLERHCGVDGAEAISRFVDLMSEKSQCRGEGVTRIVIVFHDENPPTLARQSSRCRAGRFGNNFGRRLFEQAQGKLLQRHS